MTIEYYPDSEPDRRAHIKMQIEVAALYIDRKEAKGNERKDIEKRINKKKKKKDAVGHVAQDIERTINKEVEMWNWEWPKARNYIDLHWATLNGALDLVARRVAGSRAKKWYLETGVGNHSVGHFPVIKEALLARYGEDIQVHDLDKGILVLKAEREEAEHRRRSVRSRKRSTRRLQPSTWPGQRPKTTLICTGPQCKEPSI
ncbi:hypothetical protein CAEBREN_09840 [Caenorhabditis brenneri]|uniref:Smr domain-containing protein n=1 Tax=Caenorhabditis brenneri TaxID=135651 RepID=G0PIQ1_CAEBE|nr:hypothetical protein CAEBREN_09840 [Caenorhabditis brenneri]